MYGAFYDFYECWSHYPILPFILIGWGESIEFIIYGRRWCDYSDLRGSMDHVLPPSGASEVEECVGKEYVYRSNPKWSGESRCGSEPLMRL